MKYEAIDSNLFIRNRQKLKNRLAAGSIAIFNSSDIMPTSADGNMPFKQDASFFYMTGIDQEESILLIAPDYPNDSYKEILFLKETSELIAIWEGHKYTKAEATKTSGIQTVMWLDQFEGVLNTILAETSSIYLDANEHIRNSSKVETRTDRFNKWIKDLYPLHRYERLAPILSDLRMVKEEQEIALIQKACDITEIGFRKVLKTLKPGIGEHEIEAEYAYEFLKNRANGFAFDPIMASGANACVLHYLDNDQICQDGDLILMDVGACYGNYNADMTRVLPVNGKFSDRQRDVYQAVLNVKNFAASILTAGTLITEYSQEVGQYMTSELIGLGLLDKTDVANQNPDQPLYRKYFMHGTSHHLGVNVHDVSSFYKKLENNMVLTIEPGIYIREEGIGVRLEDDVVVTEGSPINLMKNIPIEIEEIEQLMNE